MFNKKLIIASLVLITVVGFIAIFTKDNIDTPPDGDGIVLDYSDSASLVDSEDLLNAVGSIDAYDRVRKDIYTFGKKTYQPYITNSTKAIGFAISKKSVTKNGSDISLEGKYGSSSDEIKISIKLLSNFRIKISITDIKTGRNIDSELPSNNKLNQLIGILPYDSENYSISYSDRSLKVVVRLDFFTEELKAEALDYIRKVVGDENIVDKYIEVFYPAINTESGQTEYKQSYISPLFYYDPDYSDED